MGQFLVALVCAKVMKCYEFLDSFNASGIGLPQFAEVSVLNWGLKTVALQVPQTWCFCRESSGRNELHEQGLWRYGLCHGDPSRLLWCCYGCYVWCLTSVVIPSFQLNAGGQLQSFDFKKPTMVGDLPAITNGIQSTKRRWKHYRIESSTFEYLEKLCLYEYTYSCKKGV